MTGTKLTAAVLAGAALAMLGVAFASKPLYDAFCNVTGFGGTTRIASAPPSGAIEREVTIRFDANVNGLPIQFAPDQVSIKVPLGTNALAFYHVTNTSDKPVRAVASYNVTPHKAGPYFSKLECFCFVDQVFQPGETMQLPVVFFVDAAMDEERNLRDVGTITLSYTFFPSEKADVVAASVTGAVADGGGK